MEEKKYLGKECLNEVVDLAKPDPELKEFLRKSERFADLFNAVCFEGEQVLSAANLSEIDTDVSGVIAFKEYRESLVRNRDVIKKAVDGTKFLILGVENQVAVDYTMPLRVMVYDGMSYMKEIKGAGTEGDHLKVTPIITIVMYYGKKSWNGPRRLKDMMGEIPDNLDKFISDYQMNLVEVLHDKDYDFKDEDVKMLFDYSQAIIQKDKRRIEELGANYRLNSDVVYAIGKFVDITEAKEKMKKEKVEDVDMCELFDDIRADGERIGRAKGERIGRADGERIGEARGKAEGIVMTLKMLNYEVKDIVITLRENLGLSEAEAMEYCK